MKQNKAITLIALIITIIVLLILAGVVIYALTENNSIIENANKAAKKSNNSIEKENILINDLFNKLDRYFNVTTSNESTEPTKPDEPDYGISQEERESLVFLQHFDVDNVNNAYLYGADKVKFGNGALYLNSTYESDNTNNYSFTSDFTIDYWVKEETNNSMSPHLVVEANGGIWIGKQNGVFMVGGYNATTIIQLNDELPTKEWVHVAVTRKNNVVYVFFNGILKGYSTDNRSFSNGKLLIGTDGPHKIIGTYIDEIRILKGTAVWDSNFTVPNTEYGSSDGIIYHFNETKYEPDRDSIANNTSTLSTTEKKFGNGSRYFNGTNLSYKDDDRFGFSSDFTIDYWVKGSGDISGDPHVPHLVVETNNGIWIGKLNGKFVVKGYNSSSAITINDLLPENEWTHIAITRKDQVLYVFFNGILKGTANDNNIYPKGKLLIGTDGVRSVVDFYIDEMRILNGVAAWTSNFTVPNKPYEY